MIHVETCKICSQIMSANGKRKVYDMYMSHLAANHREYYDKMRGQVLSSKSVISDELNKISIILNDTLTYPENTFNFLKQEVMLIN